jgi:hypothetical protein
MRKKPFWITGSSKDGAQLRHCHLHVIFDINIYITVNKFNNSPHKNVKSLFKQELPMEWMKSDRISPYNGDPHGATSPPTLSGGWGALSNIYI